MLGKITNMVLIGFFFVVTPISSSFSSIAALSVPFPKVFSFVYSAASRSSTFVVNTFSPGDHPVVREYEHSAPYLNVEPAMSEYELSSQAAPEKTFFLDSVPSLPRSKEAFRHYFPLEFYKSKARVFQELKLPILHFPLSHKEIFNQLSLPTVPSFLTFTEQDRENDGFSFDLFTRDYRLSLPVIAKDIKNANGTKEPREVAQADDIVDITPASQEMNAENSSHVREKGPRKKVPEEEHISENAAPFMAAPPAHFLHNPDDLISALAPAEEAQSDEERPDTSTGAPPASQCIVPHPLTLMRHLSLSGTITEVKKVLTTQVVGPKISVKALRKTRMSTFPLPLSRSVKSLTGFVPGTGQRELDAAFDIVRFAGSDLASSRSMGRIRRIKPPQSFTAHVQVLNPRKYRASIFLGKPRAGVGNSLLMAEGESPFFTNLGRDISSQRGLTVFTPHAVSSSFLGRRATGNSFFPSIFNLSMTPEDLKRFAGLFRGVNFSRPFVLSILANRRHTTGLFQEEDTGVMASFSMRQERGEEGALIEYSNTLLASGVDDENDIVQSLAFNLSTAGQLLGQVAILRRKISGVQTFIFAWTPLTRSRLKLTSSGNNPFSLVKRKKANSFVPFSFIMPLPQEERERYSEATQSQIALLRKENVLPGLALPVPSVQDQEFPLPSTAVVSTNLAEPLRAQVLSMPRTWLIDTQAVILDAIEKLKVAFALQNISDRFNEVAAQAPEKDFLTNELEDEADNEFFAHLFMKDHYVPFGLEEFKSSHYVPFEFEEDEESEECVSFKAIKTIEEELSVLIAANHVPVASPKDMAKIEEDLCFEAFLEAGKNSDLSFEKFLVTGRHSDLLPFPDFRDELVAFG